MAVTKLGIEPLAAWDYTPYEIELIAEQVAYKQKEQLKQSLIAAYYTESFARQKRLPKLQKVLDGIDKKQKNTLSKGDILLKMMAKEKGVKI